MLQMKKLSALTLILVFLLPAISSNTILAVNEGICQIITYGPSDQKMSGNIINNLIESKGNTINLNNNVLDLQIAFNTFSSTEASVVYFTEEIKESVSKITLFANTLLSWTEAPILDIVSYSIIDNVDANNIYNANGFFATKVGSIEAQNLAGWKATMNAKNSISVDPMLVSINEESFKFAKHLPSINTGLSAYDIGNLSIIQLEDANLVKNHNVGAGEYDQAALEKLKIKFELAFQK